MRSLAVAFACIAAPCFAEPVALTAPEIEAALSGKTAIGDWKGRAYRQFFNTDGSTIFAMRRSQSTLGEWRVNARTDQYESKWSDPEWESYGVSKDGVTLYWTGADLEPQAFELVEGDDLLWPEQKKN